MNKQKNSFSDVQLSKSLSWLLRHGATKKGLNLDDGGFVDVQDILNLEQFKIYSLDDILRVVNNNDKKRFTLCFKEGNDKNIRIRANQGHSIPVDDDKLLIQLTKDTIPLSVYHGTYLSKLELIKKEGLSKMNRNHIHFTRYLPGDGQIISGMRGNCDAIIVVDSLKAVEDGFKFYVSDNDVILCSGNAEEIPPMYFKQINLRPKKSQMTSTQ